jgi:hypothetical protein
MTFGRIATSLRHRIIATESLQLLPSIILFYCFGFGAFPPQGELRGRCASPARHNRIPIAPSVPSAPAALQSRLPL